MTRTKIVNRLAKVAKFGQIWSLWLVSMFTFYTADPSSNHSEGSCSFWWVLFQKNKNQQMMAEIGPLKNILIERELFWTEKAKGKLLISTGLHKL